MSAVTSADLLSCRLLQEEKEEIHNSDGDAANCVRAHPHLWPGSDHPDAEHHGGRILPRSHCEYTLTPSQQQQARSRSEFIMSVGEVLPLLDSDEHNY